VTKESLLNSSWSFFFSFSLASYSECLSRDSLLAAINRNDRSLMLLMSSIATSILICLNIFDDNRLKLLLSDLENFSLSIKLCLKNDQFRRLYITIFRNDIYCSECRLSRILLRRFSLLLSKMMTIVSARWKDWLRLFVAERYERCRVFSLIVINLIDMHLLIFSWLCTIQFICDLIFSKNVLFLCFWWIITSHLRRRTQMTHFSFCLRNASDFAVLWLILVWWILKCLSFYRWYSNFYESIYALWLILKRLLRDRNSFEIQNHN
jgi:hypothetical protein